MITTIKKGKQKENETFEDSIRRPRRNCAEISPELIRLNDLPKGRQKRLHVLSHMLKRIRLHSIAEKMKHVCNFSFNMYYHFYTVNFRLGS